MRLFDTHCHLDFDVFDRSLESLISECRLLGVDTFLIPGTRVSAISKILTIQAQYRGVYVAFGIHPFFIDENSIDDLAVLEAELLTYQGTEGLVALGEIGLDKFSPVDYALQKEVFEAQLRLADVYDLPVVLHNRKSDQVMLDLLDRYSIRAGVVHAFSGSVEIAREFISRGLKLGIGGVITWSNAHKVRSMVEQLPMEAIVLETDSPEMSPQWLKGEANTPKSVPRIAEYLAQLKGVSVSDVAEITYSNACELFGI